MCDLAKLGNIGNGIPGNSRLVSSGIYSTLWEKYKVIEPSNFDTIHTSVKSSFANISVGALKKIPAIDFYIDPALIDNVNITKAVDALTKVMQLEAFLFPAEYKTPISIVIFNDWAWLQKIHVDGGCSLSSAADRANLSMDNASGWASADIAALYLNYSGSKKSTLERGTPGFLAAHEIFHLVQYQIISQVNYKTPLDVPGWFREGGATLMSPLVLDALGDLNSDHWPFSAMDNGIAKDNEPKASLEKLAANNQRNYTLGPIACEFLIYLAGFNNYMNIWLEMAKGKIFSVAFQDATGISLKDFYSMFEEIRPALGVPIS